MKVSVIIVNYKTPQLVLNCIQSIFQYQTNDIEIIVVDNNSDDDIEIALSRTYPEVLFIQMTYNAGFARANNAGLKLASGATALLLNSDTIILNDAINKAFDHLNTTDYVGCGVQLLNLDGTPQISGNFAMKGGLNYLLPLPYVGKWFKTAGDIFKVKKPNVPDASGVVDIDWINGAFLMVKKTVIDKAGLLDEDFFLYAEEAEWCSRIKKYGKLCIIGDIKVIHLQGASANDAFASEGKGYFNLYDKKGLQIMVSNFVRIRKEFGAGWFLLIFAFYVITIPIFFIAIMFAKLFFSSAKYSFSQWEAYTKNVARISKLFPTIIRNEPYFYKVL